MLKLLPIISCLSLVLPLIGCSDARISEEVAESPIQWGDTAGGLQVGIAAQTSAASPARPQGSISELEGVKIYLRNNGQSPLLIVDPSLTGGGTDPQPAIATISAGPSSRPLLVQTRSYPGHVLELIPSQSVSFSFPLTDVHPDSSGSITLSFQYQNADSVMPIGLPQGSRPAPIASGVWTGTARSSELKLDSH